MRSLFKKATGAPVVAALAGLFAAAPAGAIVGPTPISTCGTSITTPGSYALTQNLSCDGVALSINASNVTVSLDGHTITATDTAVRVAGNAVVSDVTVTGPGTLTGSQYGFVLLQASNSGFDGVTATGSGYGGAVQSGTRTGNFVRNGNFHHNLYVGIWVYESAPEISGNTCSDAPNGRGIELGYSAGGSNVHDNTCERNQFGIINFSTGPSQIHHNTLLANSSYDGYDVNSNCGATVWSQNHLVTFNQACVNNAPGAGAGTGGPVCTITGTAGADRLRGTSGDDVICGLGGDDVLDGRGGNDEVYGDDGNDTVIGKGGNDKLVGGIGNDLLLPGAGDDTADGGDGTRDRVLFSDITGGGVHVLLASGAVSPEGGSNVGSDTLSNIEQVFGSQQADVLIAQIAGVASTLKGGAGDDQLDVGDGDGLDTVVGNQGADTCNTDAGDRAREC
jgi:Ca2+-binding RTX toxin-like protein